MFHHNDLGFVIAQQRQIDLQAQADNHRLLKTIKANTPAFRERVLLSIGEFLISCGLYLRRRVQAAGRQTLVSTSQITESATNV